MKKKVFVGLSGGVDSAVSAALLLEQGYDVTGVFMKNWSGEDYGISDSCPWKTDLDDSIAICKQLGIKHKVYNFEKEYRNLVINNFFEEYRKGNTPNPDVLCNKYIKFDLFLKRAISEGADFIATGHYAQNIKNELFRGKDKNKDQTYFLYQITSEQLAKTLFPVGNLYKSEVRAIAQNKKLSVSKKKDSQGICFVGKINVRKFLESELPSQSGAFINFRTNIKVGEHTGAWFYTIGQRKGIQIGGTKEPYFVVAKDVNQNIVYIVEGRQSSELLRNDISITDMHLINNNDQSKILDLKDCSNLYAQIRYRGEIAKIEKIDSLREHEATITRIRFENSVWAPAIGQSVVIYLGEKCIGGELLTSIN